MNERRFLDTNVLIYCYTSTEPKKRSQAQLVASLPDTIISTQVLKEFVNILRKKFKQDWPVIKATLDEVISNFEVYKNDTFAIKKACSIAERYGTSFYDSLIIAAALENNCFILYSEDMQHSQVIEQRLTIKNPFLS